MGSSQETPFARCSRVARVTRGHYEPLALTINLAQRLSKVGAGTGFVLPRSHDSLALVHEHEHLIQETTTLHGIMSFLAYWRAVRSLRAANDAHEGRLVLPHANEHGEPGSEESREWLSWVGNVDGDGCRSVEARGFRPESDYTVTKVRFDEARVTPIFEGGEVRLFPTPGVTVEVRQDGERFDIELGAYIVNESLAATLDRHMWKHTASPLPGVHPPFPYGMLSRLSEYLRGPKRVGAPSPRVLATFADRSLMTIAPGYYVTRYLSRYCRDRLRNSHAICDSVEKDCRFKANVALDMALADLKALAVFFHTSERRARFFLWFIGFIEEGVKARNDRDAYLRPFSSNDPWRECEERIKRHHPPLLIDTNNELFNLNLDGYSDDSGDAARLFQGLLFATGLHAVSAASMACPLFANCRSEFKSDEPDSPCHIAPWVHANREKTCAVGAAFASLGTKGREVDYVPLDRK